MWLLLCFGFVCWIDLCCLLVYVLCCELCCLCLMFADYLLWFVFCSVCAVFGLFLWGTLRFGFGLMLFCLVYIIVLRIF